MARVSSDQLNSVSGNIGCIQWAHAIVWLPELFAQLNVVCCTFLVTHIRTIFFSFSTFCPFHQSPEVERYRHTARSPPTNDPNRNFMQILITKFHCFNSKLFSGKIAIIFGRKIKFAERIRHRNCVGSSCENELWSRKEIIFAQKVMVTTPLTWAYDHIQTGNVWCVLKHTLYLHARIHTPTINGIATTSAGATTVLAKAQYWTLHESSIVSPKRERKNAIFFCCWLLPRARSMGICRRKKAHAAALVFCADCAISRWGDFWLQLVRLLFTYVCVWLCRVRVCFRNLWMDFLYCRIEWRCNSIEARDFVKN